MVEKLFPEGIPSVASYAQKVGVAPICVNLTWSRTGEQRTGNREWAMSSLLATCAGGFRGGSQVPARAVGRQPRGDLEHSDSEFKQPLCDGVALHSPFPVLCSPFPVPCSLFSVHQFEGAEH